MMVYAERGTYALKKPEFDVMVIVNDQHVIQPYLCTSTVLEARPSSTHFVVVVESSERGAKEQTTSRQWSSRERKKLPVLL